MKSSALTLTDNTTRPFSCFIFVTRNGAFVLHAPRWVRQGMDGDYCDDNGFRNVPKRAGLYRCKGRFEYHMGYFEGYPHPGESDWEFIIESSERIPLSLADRPKTRKKGKRK